MKKLFLLYLFILGMAALHEDQQNSTLRVRGKILQEPVPHRLGYSEDQDSETLKIQSY